MTSALPYDFGSATTPDRNFFTQLQADLEAIVGVNEYWAEDFGMVGDNATDNTPFWNAMVTELQAQSTTYTRRGASIRFRPAVYLFNSQPSAISFPIRLSGVAGPFFKTMLARNYTPGSADDPFITTLAGYFMAEYIDFIAGSGTSGGRCLQFIQQDSGPFKAGSWVFLNNLRSQGGVDLDHSGTFKTFLYAQGDNTAASGVRDITCLNCWSFDCSGPPIHLISAQQFSWIGGYFSSTTGTHSIITGTVGLPSQNIWIAPSTADNFEVSHTNGIHATGTFGNTIVNPGTIASTVTGYQLIVYDAQDWVLNSESGTYENPYYPNRVSSEVAIGAAISVSNGTTTNLATITLTAGDWDVHAVAHFVPTGNFSKLISTIASATTTLDNSPPEAYNEQSYPAAGGGNTFTLKTGPRRVHVATSTTMWVTMYVVFSTGAMTAWGQIYARRAAG